MAASRRSFHHAVRRRRCSVLLSALASEHFDARIDRTQLRGIDGQLFIDGFEGGTTGAWSQTVP